MKRQNYNLVERYLELFPCVVLIGPRQCGKTSILKQFQKIKKSWKYFDLEKISDFEHITRDADLFFRKNRKDIIIDEAQLSPELFSALRVSIDDDRSTPGRFLLSGSSSPELVKSISESLAGRVALIEVSPFSFSEINHTNKPFLLELFSPSFEIEDIEEVSNIKYHKTLDKFWFHGGYPEPWIKDDEFFFDTWREQYVKTYLNRDIARLFPNINSNRFYKFIQILSGLSGEIINYSNIARLLDVSQPVIKDYLAIAHGTFIWRTIPAFDRNLKKRIVKHPKGHLRDTGLLHHLLQIPSSKKLLSHPKFGSSFEILVIEEILRTLNNYGINYKEFHYRTSTGAEIDLLLEGKFGLVPIEIKYASAVKSKQLITIKAFIEEFNCPFGIVVNNDDKIRFYADKLIGIPFSYLVS